MLVFKALSWIAAYHLLRIPQTPFPEKESCASVGRQERGLTGLQGRLTQRPVNPYTFGHGSTFHADMEAKLNEFAAATGRAKDDLLQDAMQGTSMSLTACGECSTTAMTTSPAAT